MAALFAGSVNGVILLFFLPGDVVFLTSDGIADNFDPIVRKKVRGSSGTSNAPHSPSKGPRQCNTSTGSLRATSSSSSIDADSIGANLTHEMPALVSPAEAHEMTLNSMANLLIKQQQRKTEQLQEGLGMPLQTTEQQQQQLQPDMHGRIQALEPKQEAEQKGANKLLHRFHKQHHKQPPSPTQATAAAGAASGAGKVPPEYARVGLSAREVASTLLHFVVKQTTPYRQLVEERVAKVAAAGGSTALSFAPQSKRADIMQEDEELFLRQLANTPGKPDHATIVACQVGLMK